MPDWLPPRLLVVITVGRDLLTMLPLSRSRICRIAPYLLVPKTHHSSHSRFLLVKHSALQPFSGNHQLLRGSTSKWSNWIRKVGSQTEVNAATLSPTTEEKPKDDKPFRRLLALAHPERYVIGASVACLCVSSAVTMSVPYCIGKILDIIFTDSFMAEKLSAFCLGMVGVFVVGSAANFGRIYLMNGACEYRNRVWSLILF